MSRARRPAAQRGALTRDGGFVNPLVAGADALKGMTPAPPEFVAPAPLAMPVATTRETFEQSQVALRPSPAVADIEDDEIDAIEQAIAEATPAVPLAPPVYRWEIPDIARAGYSRILDVNAADADAAREYLLTSEDVTLDRIERAFVRGEEPVVVRAEVELELEHDAQLQRADQLAAKLAAYAEAEQAALSIGTTLETLPEWLRDTDEQAEASVMVAVKQCDDRARAIADALLVVRDVLDRALGEAGYRAPAPPPAIYADGVVVNLPPDLPDADRIREALPGALVLDREASAELSESEKDGMKLIGREIADMLRSKPLGHYEQIAVRAALTAIRERMA